MGQMLLLHNIRKTYGKTEVLHNINMEINEGDIIGIAGENGSGKSTLVKIILGIIKKYEGKLISNTKDIGFVPDQIQLLDQLTIYDYLELMGIYKKNIAEIIDSEIEFWGMEKYKKTKICHLSKGNRQKVGIIQSYFLGQKMIIMDEPFSGLDYFSKEKLIKKISELKAQNKTILICTHQLLETQKYATKIAVLSEGNLLDVKSIEDIMKKYENVEEYYVKTNYAHWANGYISKN